MIALDRRKMEVAESVAYLVALPLVVAPLVILIAWGPRPISKELQFVAIGLGAFFASILVFGAFYVGMPYHEMNPKAVRVRRGACIVAWALLVFGYALIGWRLYQVST